MTGAVCATVNLGATFHSMADDSAVAVGTLRCERVYGTFETVKDVLSIVKADRETLVVVVSTYLTLSHAFLLSKSVVVLM